MKRVIPLILALLLLCVPAAATEVGSDETPTEEVIQDVGSEPVTESPSEEETSASDPETLTSETEVEGSNITVNVTLPAQEPAALSEPEIIEDEITEPIPVTYSVTTLDNKEASELIAGTLTETVERLFGPYTPRTQTVTEYLSDGSVVSSQEIVPGLAGLDYPWLASVTFFGLVMFCFFKMLGGLLK